MAKKSVLQMPDKDLSLEQRFELFVKMSFPTMPKDSLQEKLMRLVWYSAYFDAMSLPVNLRECGLDDQAARSKLADIFGEARGFCHLTAVGKNPLTNEIMMPPSGAQ